MTARAILTSKVNSHPFDDRVLLLEIPAKIGRAHKDDQADSGNGLFDCKVLSRQHAMILYEEEKFFILDTGSSNGTFVNNIRLSKTGEESKMTEIFTGDIVRLGSDIVDKSRQITQKCIVTKLKLYDCDGNLAPTRPPESRLFRATDSFEDLSTMTMSLQEALSREKMLEDKLVLVKTMISKNIGKSHTDLLRLFEDIKEELMNLYEQRESLSLNNDSSALERMGSENHVLKKEIKMLEQDLSSKDQEIGVLQKKSQADNVELKTLRKSCQLQKDDLYNIELKLQRAMEDIERLKNHSEVSLQDKAKEFDRKLAEREAEFDREQKSMKERLHDVLSNEENLLNRIKSLESDEDYARTEVDKVLHREREVSELNQQLQYQVEQLELKLSDAIDTIEEQKGQVVVKRDDEDIAKIAEQDKSIANLQQELAYVRKELIEARAHKSASDDKLSTVQDKIETMQNNINSLSDEGTRLKKVITGLEESLEIKTKEAEHLQDLVSKMEATPGQDEMNKVQIADLKHELAKAEENLRIRTEELFQSKKDLRVKDEEIQQREIDISCLRGQVQNIQDELDYLKSQSDNVTAVQEEVQDLRQRMAKLQNDLNLSMGENERLMDELARQQALYTELKKMRGRGEEMDMLQQLEQESRQSQKHIVDLERELGLQSVQLETLTEEKVRLLRELAQLRAAANSGRPLNVDDTNGGYYYTSTPTNVPKQPSTTTSANLVPKVSNNATISSVGALRLYEFCLGIFFIAAMMNWILV